MLAVAAIVLGLVAGLASGGSVRVLARRDSPNTGVLLLLFLLQALFRGPLASS